MTAASAAVEQMLASEHADVLRESVAFMCEAARRARTRVGTIELAILEPRCRAAD